MRKLTSAILAVGLAVSAPLAAAAQQLSLNEISGYLNQLRTAKGDFTQINDDGSISTGTIYIKRPGKVRFEYKTPLSIILADNVNLGRAKMVTGHSYDGTATTVTAQDPANPQYGNIQMKFTGNPVQLRQWIINDGNGSATTVVLGDMQVGGNISNSLFDTAGARAGGRR